MAVVSLATAQNTFVDSLKRQLKKTINDSTRCKILWDLSENASDNEWPLFNKELLVILTKKLSDTKTNDQEKNLFKKLYAGAINNSGYYDYLSGNNKTALEKYFKSLPIAIEFKDKKLQSSIFNNIANVYSLQGIYSEAFANYEKSLKIQMEIGDRLGLSYSYNNIAVLLSNQNEIEKAQIYYDKCIKILNELNDQEKIAQTYVNIGLNYLKFKKSDKAEKYFKESAKISEAIGYELGLANAFMHLGGIYKSKGKRSESIEFYNKSLIIRQKINDKFGTAYSLLNLGIFYNEDKQNKLALDYAMKAQALSNDLNYADLTGEIARLLKLIYIDQGNFKLALENYELEVKMRDSLNNLERKKTEIKNQANLEFTVLHAVEKEKHLYELNLHEQNAVAERKKQSTIIFFICAILILMVGFTVFLYKRFKIIKNQKIIIEKVEKQTREQKYLIEEKHKEITDSINYAERIQKSFLASNELLIQNLQDYFVFFQPKDVVSGDFYWASKLNNGNFAYACADSTGHGVPGAIMSILNISSLELAVRDRLNQPSEILNYARKEIINRLKKDGSKEGGKDGMDASLIVFNKEKTKLMYAAANNPIWLIRKNNHSPAELIEAKPDKMPIGKHERDNMPFTQHEIELQKGDVIYTLTDGYPDQFGGPKGKKYKYAQLKEFLLSISEQPMHEQHKKIKSEFERWKGNLDQIDDVCIIGIRI